MKRRVRAGVLFLLAMLAAALAAAIANGYGSSVARGYGPLRPVVVLAQNLEAGEPIGPSEIAALAVRRIPSRFVPPGTLAAPEEALGLAPVAAMPAGSYMLAAQLRPPRPRGPGGAGLGGGRRPVEVSVSGAEALLAAGPAPAERRSTSSSRPNPPAPAPAAPMSPQRACRCSRLARALTVLDPAEPRLQRWA